jgi:hypothetical protein
MLSKKNARHEKTIYNLKKDHNHMYQILTEQTRKPKQATAAVQTTEKITTPVRQEIAIHKRDAWVKL